MQRRSQQLWKEDHSERSSPQESAENDIEEVLEAVGGMAVPGEVQAVGQPEQDES